LSVRIEKGTAGRDFFHNHSFFSYLPESRYGLSKNPSRIEGKNLPHRHKFLMTWIHAHKDFVRLDASSGVRASLIESGWAKNRVETAEIGLKIHAQPDLGGQPDVVSII
jgi:hypothetical protein